jgi:hypothetical protein
VNAMWIALAASRGIAVSHVAKRRRTTNLFQSCLVLMSVSFAGSTANTIAQASASVTNWSNTVHQGNCHNASKTPSSPRLLAAVRLQGSP